MAMTDSTSVVLRRVARAALGLGLLLVVLHVSLPYLAPIFSAPLEWATVPMEDAETECFEESDPEPWSYCLTTSPGSANADLLYHFHGRRGAADWWNDQEYYSYEVHRAWREAGLDPPRVASVSFGPLWLLTEDGSAAGGGRMRTFLDHVVPTVEGRLAEPVARRMAVGESMGGVNALLVATHAGERFDRVASLCPPLSTMSPFAGYGELWAAGDEAGASIQRRLMLTSLGKHLYPTEQDWERNDPLQRVLRGQSSALPDLYLSCGERDDWGCMAGSEAFVTATRETGAEVEWHRRPGGHCDIDAASLARFLGQAPDDLRGRAPRLAAVDP